MAQHTHIEKSTLDKVCYRPVEPAKEALRKKIVEIKKRKGRATINESLDEVILEWDQLKTNK